MAKGTICIPLLIVYACGGAPPPPPPTPPAPPAPGLHEAVFAGDLEAIRRHVEAGSDLNEKDAYGSTPLIVAAAFGQTEAARALIAAGADPDLTNNDGATALHTAAFLCRTEIVRALLDNGANKYLRDNSGSTPAGSVAAPFAEVRSIYDTIARGLGPLGLVLDYDSIRVTRPRVAEMLRPRREELDAVDYTPLPGDDWKVSTPAAQGLDPALVAEMYLEATGLPTLYGLLVIRNGYLVAERYFNEGSIEQLSGRQSATKSFVSALAGLALDQGHLSSVDQKMMEFFPEFAGQIDDPRKERIAIRHLLQMRGGYPWEERMQPYLDSLFFTDDWLWLPHLVDFPLVNDPGTAFNYSNLTSHLLAVIVARAAGTDLASYAREHLFSPLGAELGRWTADPEGYNWGWGEIYVTARDMAKFGLLYLQTGEFEGKQVLPADWVAASLENYSGQIPDTDGGAGTHGRYFRDRGYGYQWWSATAGAHPFDYAAGHGGQLIVLLHDLNMVIITTADPLYELPTDDGWKYEGAIVDMVGKFIASLPEG